MTSLDSPRLAQADPPTAGDQPAGRPGRWGRRLLALSSAVLVTTAATTVPMPWVETRPGSVVQVHDLLVIDASTTPLTGDLGLLTVRVRQPSIVGAVRAHLDPERHLRPSEDVFHGLTQRQHMDRQRGVFREAFSVAAGVGLAAAGHDVVLRTAPQVARVLDGGPSDGILVTGDVIRSFNGVAVTTVEQLLEFLEDAEADDELRLSVERGDILTNVRIVAGDVPGLDRPGMGIGLQTFDERIELPFAVTLVDQRGIGGPSAGLVTALTVYDLVSDEDLVRGRRIVGTGTVDSRGVVGTVGGVPDKVRTAIARGADLMLVPRPQLEIAQQAAAGRLAIVGVSTFEQALGLLRL